ncbi:DUF6671 family protein [Leifsonia shinshuensis]
MSEAADSYRGATIVFATRHGKERQAAAPFHEQLAAHVIAPDDIDTDQFGTFTGDIERTRTPLSAALDKALLGTALTGRPYALASEATYASAWGVLARHHELLLFHDRERQMTLTENTVVTVRGHGTTTVAGAEDAQAAAVRFGFPATHAVALIDDETGVVARKGLADTDALRAAVTELLARGAPVHIGPDYRAHANPERQVVITSLAERMAYRLTQLCPACRTPGWGVVGVERGLPCDVCGEPTAGITADVYGCGMCGSTRPSPRPNDTISAQWCNACNP